VRVGVAKAADQHGHPVLRARAEAAPFRVSDITYAHQDTADVDAQARPVHQPVPDVHGAMVHGLRRDGRQLQARGPGANTPIRLKLVLRTNRHVQIRLDLDPEELLRPGALGHRRATSSLGCQQNA
jgi:hypothetical protein